MAHGPLSLLYGDLDMSNVETSPRRLVAFALAGPLRLKLPNGSDLTIHDGWYVWLPVEAFGNVLAATIDERQTKVQHHMGALPDMMEQRRELTEAGYELPPDDDETEVPF